MKATHRNHHRFTIEKNVLKSREVSYHDDYTSIGESLFRKLAEDPKFVGQTDAVTGEEYTYRKMRERSVRCALWMQSQGLRSRDVVASCCENNLDFAIPCFAAFFLGAAFTPWHAILPAGDVCHQINITKPKMVFASETAAPVIAEAAKTAEVDIKIIVFGTVPGFFEFKSIIAEPRLYEVAKFDCSPIESPEEIALMIFSSGTTGLPKAVALSHRALNMHFRQSQVFGMAGNVCLCFTTVGWISGIFSTLWSVLLNIPAIILPPFEERSACALIEKYKASWVFFTATIINKLWKYGAVQGRLDLSSVSRVVHGGAGLSIAAHKAFAELLPNAEIFGSYGLTETCGPITLQSTKSQPGSCGQLMENAQLKVIDHDSGRILGANEKGEILLKSVSMMSYYYNNPEATNDTIDDDGWLHTGDFGYYNEAGEIFVIDRLKDMIRCEDDCNISPSAIEGVILSHPGVKDVGVVGQPHPDGYELPIAFVVRADNSSDTNNQVTETEIVNLVASKIPDSRTNLRAGVRFIDHIPRKAANKILRTALRDLAGSMVKI